MPGSEEYERGRADAAKQAMREEVRGLNLRVVAIEDKLRDLSQKFNEYVAVASASRETLRESSQKTVSTREFYIGVGVLILSFAGLLLGIKG